MRLSKTQLAILRALAKGLQSSQEIAEDIGKSYSQTIKALRALEHKNILDRQRDQITLVLHQHVALLLQELSEHQNLLGAFANSGMPVLQQTLKPRPAIEIAERTGLSRQMVHRVIKRLRKMSILRKEGSEYVLNEQLWPRLQNFIRTLNQFESTIDDRLPPGTIIYKKKENFVLFSTKKRIDATPAAFSAFEEFGMNVLLTKNYYILPKKNISAKDVLQQCLWILERDFSVQLVLLTAVFYKKTSVRIDHPIIENIDAALAGKNIPRYPGEQEIRERAELYGVTM